MKTCSLIAMLLVVAVVRAEDAPLKLFTIVPGADVILEDDYGIMLINDGNERQPSPRYILGIRASRTVLDTRDLRVFRAALGTLPKGTRLIPYDSCTVSRSHGLSASNHSEFTKAVNDAALIVDEEARRITCYCEALEGRRAEPNGGANAASPRRSPS